MLRWGNVVHFIVSNGNDMIFILHCPLHFVLYWRILFYIKHVNVHCKGQQMESCAFYCQLWKLDDIHKYHLSTILHSDTQQLFPEYNGLIESHLVRCKCVIFWKIMNLYNWIFIEIWKELIIHFRGMLNIETMTGKMHQFTPQSCNQFFQREIFVKQSNCPSSSLQKYSWRSHWRTLTLWAW